MLERVISNPDFVFSARDFDQDHSYYSPFVDRPSADIWNNLATENGNPAGTGPGIIRPSINLNFYRLGQEVTLYDFGPENQPYFRRAKWAFIDNPTNSPTILPGSPATIDHYNLVLLGNYDTRVAKWRLPLPQYSTALLQISADLLSWKTVTTVTNQGTEITFYDLRRRQTQYYRVIPQ